MGGSGSGYQGIAWPATDGLPRLDVRWLARERLVEIDRAVFTTMTWDRGGDPIATVGAYFDGAARLTLTYSLRRQGDADWTDVKEGVAVDRTACRFGGSRPWLRCPGCRRRVAVLWMVGGWFRCRGCHGLAYSSTRDSPLERANRRAGKLRVRLGLPEQAPWPMHGVFWKPARMHYRTYAAIVGELSALSREREAILDAGFARLIARIDPMIAGAYRDLGR